MQRVVGVWTACLVSGALLGCTAVRAPTQADVPEARGRGPIARALEYLENTQVKRADEPACGPNWSGNWPFRVEVRSALGCYRAVEVASGLPAYTHGVLALVHEGTASTLGIGEQDVARAQRMRLRTMAFVERFREDGPEPQAYGWWPVVPAGRRRWHPLAAWAAERWLAGPFQRGTRAPPGPSLVPPAAWMVSDVDDTAYALCARLDHHRLDDGRAPPKSIRVLFEPWRDVSGSVRAAPAWLPEASGAYLTWMAPPRAGRMPNEVDPIINANVLLTLARYGELDAAGAREAQAVILRTVREGRHRSGNAISSWYSRRAFHLLVARAFAEGPVPALEPAVRILAADLGSEAQPRPDGTASWGPDDPGEQALQTAVAVSALALAGGYEDLVRAGAKRLVALQDARTGGWAEATLCGARAGSGAPLLWRGSAAPFALEALLRAR